MYLRCKRNFKILLILKFPFYFLLKKLLLILSQSIWSSLPDKGYGSLMRDSSPSSDSSQTLLLSFFLITLRSTSFFVSLVIAHKSWTNLSFDYLPQNRIELTNWLEGRSEFDWTTTLKLIESRVEISYNF